MVNVKKRENAQLALVRFLGLGCVSNEPVQKLAQVRISTLLAKYQIIQVFTACQVVKALRAVTFFLLPICKIKLVRKSHLCKAQINYHICLKGTIHILLQTNL